MFSYGCHPGLATFLVTPLQATAYKWPETGAPAKFGVIPAGL